MTNDLDLVTELRPLLDRQEAAVTRAMNYCRAMTQAFAEADELAAVAIHPVSARGGSRLKQRLRRVDISG